MGRPAPLRHDARRSQPDLFIHCGDTIYADSPLQPEVKLDDGTVWKNVVTQAKSKAAETLDDFRGSYQYNLLDEHMRALQRARSPQIVLWDDHEVRDNWYPTRDLAERRRATRRQEHGAARGARAPGVPRVQPAAGRPRTTRSGVYRTVACGPLVEVFALDLRSYRGANSENRQPALDDDVGVWAADAARLAEGAAGGAAARRGR